MIKISFLLAKDYFLPHITSGLKVSTPIMNLPPPVLRNAFVGAGQKGVILISIGGIGSADKGLAFFPQNEAEMPIHRAATGLFPCISLRASLLGIPPGPMKELWPCDDEYNPLLACAWNGLEYRDPLPIAKNWGVARWSPRKAESLLPRDFPAMLISRAMIPKNERLFQGEFLFAAGGK